MFKKVLYTVFLLQGLMLPAQSAYRSAGLMTWEWDDHKDELSDLNEEDIHFFGFQSEIISHNVGYGLDALVNFREDSVNRSLLDWQGQLFLRYHLFGSRSFLDPFLEAGAGNGGSVRITDGKELKLSLYPYVGAGMNLVFKGGFFIGGRWSCKMTEWGIPGTSYPLTDLSRYQATLQIGMVYDWGRPEPHHRPRHPDPWCD